MNQLSELPSEIILKIFDYFTYEDIKNNYLVLIDFKEILDYIIKKKNYDFLGRFEFVLDNIVFQDYKNAHSRIRNNYQFYGGIVKEIYQNREISIKMWNDKCKKYNLKLDYIPKILNFVLLEYQDRYNRENLIRLNMDGLFLNSLVTYLNY